MGFRHCFTLRNQGNVSDAIALKNWVLSSIDGEVVNRMNMMKIRSSAWWNLLSLLRRPQLKDRTWIQITKEKNFKHFIISVNKRFVESVWPAEYKNQKDYSGFQNSLYFPPMRRFQRYPKFATVRFSDSLVSLIC